LRLGRPGSGSPSRSWPRSRPSGSGLPSGSMTS
jgi:hypothetical protein